MTLPAQAFRPAVWLQLAKFSFVGALGYGVNLLVYAFALSLALDFRLAAVAAFAVAVSHNYTLNRLWTFRAQRGHVGFQGLRYLLVSLAALALNLVILTALVELGVGELPAQAAAIALVMPASFLGNRLWSFR